MRRREADDEVGALTVELLDDLAGDLADRLERQRMQRERGRVAVYEIHAPADSAPITPELSGNHGSGRAVSGTVTADASSTIEQQRLDRARLGELELALHEAISELARLDEERLAVAADLFAAPPEHGLERRVAVGAVGRPHEHDEMRLHAGRVRRRPRSRRTHR